MYDWIDIWNCCYCRTYHHLLIYPSDYYFQKHYLLTNFFSILPSSCTSSLVTSKDRILFFLISTATCIVKYPFLTRHLLWCIHHSPLLAILIPVLYKAMTISFPNLSLILISSLFMRLLMVYNVVVWLILYYLHELWLRPVFVDMVGEIYLLSCNLEAE